MNFLDYPITPSPKKVEEFRQLMKKHYNVDYSDGQANEGAYNLVNFFRVLMKMDIKIKNSRKKFINTLREISRIK